MSTTQQVDAPDDGVTLRGLLAGQQVRGQCAEARPPEEHSGLLLDAEIDIGVALDLLRECRDMLRALPVPEDNALLERAFALLERLTEDG